jgi:hypothetical protein
VLTSSSTAIIQKSKSEDAQLITKASELLELFIKEETKKLAGIDMPHMPTLGSAYEEVTKQGIDQEFSIPKFLDLSVVSGFISVGGEMLPEQIDCMLVHGSGEKYGLTDQYIYSVENVLCIFEVKKTLNKQAYMDAIEHLAGIRKKFAHNFEHKLIHEGYEPDISSARRHFAQIAGKTAPDRYSGIHSLPEDEGVLFYCLVQESLAPISIIHGYDGYKTEKGLRTAFIDILEEKKLKDGSGVGIPSIPSLVTCGQYALVKANGVPFITVRGKDEWISIFSTRHNAAKLILELVWSKISSFFDLKMPWGDGLHMDNVEPLLISKVVRAGEKVGWMYNTLEPKEKHLKREDDIVWEPSALGAAEVSAVQIMAMHGGYLAMDDGMNEYFNEKYETSIKEVADHLISTRLFMKDGEYLRPIHSLTHMVAEDDSSGYVCCERDRFDLWCEDNGITPHYINLVLMD